MKATIPLADMIVCIGVIAAEIFLFITIIKLGLAGETADLIMEQASISYYIAASANSLSLVDEGRMEIQLAGTYDLKVTYEEPNYYITVKYTDFKTNEREVKNAFLTKVKETTISSTSSVCIVKGGGDDVEVKKEC